MAIGFGADLFAFGGADGTQLVGDARTLRFHAAVHRFRNFRRELDPAQTDVDDLHTQGLGTLGDVGQDLGHDLVAFGRYHVAHRAHVDRGVQRVADLGLQPFLRRALIAAERHVEQARVRDAPLDVGVDQQVLLFGSLDAFGFVGFDGQNALVERHDILERRRGLEIQARFADDLAYFTEREHQGVIALSDDEDAGGKDGKHNEQADQDRHKTVHDQDSSGLARRTVAGQRVAIAAAGRLRRRRGVATQRRLDGRADQSG
ncbi:hypothetical protein D3C85_1118150 [compost metagenome]